jgi:L-seryl-tRNA(Ser) seleniumtransferase
MLYPAVVRSLEGYRPERVRELVETTARLADALPGWIDRTPFAANLPAEGILAEAMRRAGMADSPIVAYEATAALAMLLLRDHGILTTHFAALPPGTDALLLKFIPPEMLERFGGPEAFAEAVDAALDELARLLPDRDELSAVLVGS